MASCDKSRPKRVDAHVTVVAENRFSISHPWIARARACDWCDLAKRSHFIMSMNIFKCCISVFPPQSENTCDQVQQKNNVGNSSYPHKIMGRVVVIAAFAPPDLLSRTRMLGDNPDNSIC